MSITIDDQKCTVCGICVEICPENVLVMTGRKVKAEYADECWYCGSCMMDCHRNAINVSFPRHMRPVILKS